MFQLGVTSMMLFRCRTAVVSKISNMVEVMSSLVFSMETLLEASRKI